MIDIEELARQNEKMERRREVVSVYRTMIIGAVVMLIIAALAGYFDQFRTAVVPGAVGLFILFTTLLCYLTERDRTNRGR